MQRAVSVYTDSPNTTGASSQPRRPQSMLGRTTSPLPPDPAGGCGVVVCGVTRAAVLRGQKQREEDAIRQFRRSMLNTTSLRIGAGAGITAHHITSSRHITDDDGDIVSHVDQLMAVQGLLRRERLVITEERQSILQLYKDINAVSQTMRAHVRLRHPHTHSRVQGWQLRLKYSHLHAFVHNGIDFEQWQVKERALADVRPMLCGVAFSCCSRRKCSLRRPMCGWAWPRSTTTSFCACWRAAPRPLLR